MLFTNENFNNNLFSDVRLGVSGRGLNFSSESLKKFDNFYNELKTQFKMDVQKGVDLYTVRHFDDKAIVVIEAKGKSLLTQINKETSQIVIAPN